jgi:hypothetical protein
MVFSRITGFQPVISSFPCTGWKPVIRSRFMPPTDLPHPTTPGIPLAALRADYINVTVDRSPDPRWRFRLNLHRSTRIAPGGDVRPDPFGSLALFQWPEPIADLEVFGLDLPVEVDAADWLDLWIERHGLTPVSSKPVPTDAGVFGDVICRWSTPEGEFGGRFATLRFANRLFLLAMRAPRDSYVALAEDFFTALSSFTPLDTDPPGSAPEPRTTLSFDGPLPATVTVPASYTMELSLAEPGQISAFTGDQQAIGSMPDDPSFGKLSFLLADLALADHPGKAAGLYLGPLLQNPVTLHGDEFVELETAPAPFLQAWQIVADATLTPSGAEPVRCELRCMILAHERAWFVAGVLGPARHEAPIAWARNKRALDIVTSTVAFAENG